MTSADIIYWSVFIAQGFLSLSLFLVLWRLIRGPMAQDRVMALDSLNVLAMMLFITFGINTSSSFYFDTALIVGLLGFVSSAALAKFLMRGEVIE